MRFRLVQRVALPPEGALGALSQSSFWTEGGASPGLSVLEVLAREERSDTVELQVRFAFTGELSGAVRGFVDPDKLTWITTATVRPARLEMGFVIRPDHYPDLLRGSGTYRFSPVPEGTEEKVEGEVTVPVPVVGRMAEKALVSGLSDWVAAEAGRLVAWADRAPGPGGPDPGSTVDQ